MKFETKFSVGDLVQHKFTRQSHPDTMFEKNFLMFYEVGEVIVQQCYGGVQIFYDLRAIHAMLSDRKPKDGEPLKITEFLPGFSPDQKLIRMTEHELVEIPQWLLYELHNVELKDKPSVATGDASKQIAD